MTNFFTVASFVPSSRAMTIFHDEVLHLDLHHCCAFWYCWEAIRVSLMESLLTSNANELSPTFNDVSTHLSTSLNTSAALHSVNCPA